MNIQSRLPATPDEFLRWNEGREGKREFVNGRVVEMMISTTRRHVRLAARLIMMLGRQIDADVYDIGSADFGVRTPAGVRYPDIYVDHRTGASTDNDLAAVEPVLLAEILSPSSYGRDFVEKLADYKEIPSLRHYLIVSQDEPRVWLWSRNPESSWDGPDEIVGREAGVELAGLEAELDMAELYSGIERQ